MRFPKMGSEAGVGQREGAANGKAPRMADTRVHGKCERRYTPLHTHYTRCARVRETAAVWGEDLLVTYW